MFMYLFYTLFTLFQKIKDILLPLSELSKLCDYSPAYLKKLILLGKLEGIKQGRNWFSSENSVKRYKSNIK